MNPIKDLTSRPAPAPSGMLPGVAAAAAGTAATGALGGGAWCPPTLPVSRPSSRSRRISKGGCMSKGAWVMSKGTWVMSKGAWVMTKGAWVMSNGAWVMSKGAWVSGFPPQKRAAKEREPDDD